MRGSNAEDVAAVLVEEKPDAVHDGRELTNYQVILHRRSGAGFGERWRLLCHRMLGLDARAAERLWHALPIQMVLIRLDREELDHFNHHLERAGVEAEFVVQQKGGRGCALHHRVVADEPCPACGELKACTLCLKAEAWGRCPSCSAKARNRRGLLRFLLGAGVLAMLAVFVALTVQERRIAGWTGSLRVAVLPILADNTADVRSFVREFEVEDVEGFLEREAERYGIEVSPVLSIGVGRALPLSIPPAFPDVGASWTDRAFWAGSLLNLWIRNRAKAGLGTADVRVLALFRTAARRSSPRAPRAHAGAHIAVVELSADEDAFAANDIALAQGILAALGARMKVDEDGEPLFPAGYAFPNRRPPLPQFRAEIMAGRIPLTEETSVLPSSIDDCVVGKVTASEIGWWAAP